MFVEVRITENILDLIVLVNDFCEVQVLFNLNCDRCRPALDVLMVAKLAPISCGGSDSSEVPVDHSLSV